MIKVDNLTVKIGGQKILNGLSCSLNSKKITCFIGKSGAGKTTLLKSLVNLVPITEGNITIDRIEFKNLSQKKKAEIIGYVFQDFNLFNNLTVFENCMGPLLVHGVDKKIAKIRVQEELKKLGMDSYVNKYPSQMSGGQQQRVAIARSLCLKPKFLLFDEPTASLDPCNTQKLITILESLAKDGFTIALISQDMSFVKKIANRVYFLEAGNITGFSEESRGLKKSKIIEDFITLGKSD